ncbi:hypothetical protein OHB04_02575 [Streptomyces sp. NBC_01775]|uniref:hypothetical protein n=1 Tax=Streptomyces sp. NBC_01775 TaxID=2975939 RepID=UPI002DD8C40D|nr:hypothetical protein [Streptomyces sp. NBC_01775]WSB74778.1 hypothetical protein OHB04_02575 [Streptomyces sp. NBC_01775]
MNTITATHPLPSLGLCPACEGEIRIRKNGRLYKHDQPLDSDAPIVCDSAGYWVTTCPGSGRQPAARLEPTFARWLYAQRNGDAYTDRVAGLASMKFNGCGRTPGRTPGDVDWTTPEQLHQREHDIQRQRTGSDVRQPYNGQRCDWVCRDIAAADAEYQRLVEAAA